MHYRVRKGYGAVEVELAKAETQGTRRAEQSDDTENRNSQIGGEGAFDEGAFYLSEGIPHEAGDEGEGDGGE